MTQRQQIVSRLSVALIVALALAVAWGAILLWLGYVVAQFFVNESTYESIEVLQDGTPVIKSQLVRNYAYLDATHRTLDGKLIEVDPDKKFPEATFYAPAKPPGLYEPSIGWFQRTAGASDLQRPGVDWFVVRDNAVRGSVYFSGFDHDSKSRVGYLGRNGFSRVMPPPDEWFEIGRATLNWGEQALASTGQISPARKSFGRYATMSESRLPGWLVYVIDGDRLVEVDLRGRSVRKVLDAVGIQHVVIAYEAPERSATEGITANEKASDQVANARSIDWQARVAVRTLDRLIVFDPRGAERREFTLHESLRNVLFTAYLLRPEELLAVWNEGDPSAGKKEVAWMRPDGSFSKQRTVTLAAQSVLSPYAVAWIAAPVAPVPIGWSAMTGVFAPLAMVQGNQAPGYMQALAVMLKYTVLPMLVVIAFSALLAWQTVKLQRKYHRPATLVWATFVFLLGLPGFLAYLVEQRRPKMEACPQCNEIVPRDRSACASCNAEFLAPPRLGMEILA